MSWAWVVCDFNLLTITCVCGWSREREGKKKEIGREGQATGRLQEFWVEQLGEWSCQLLR